MRLTPSLEDYLKSIYILLLSKREVRVSDIASYMGVRLPSVSEALKRLKDRGLVVYDKYSSIYLTSKGLEVARNIVKKHQLILYFLQNILGLPPDIASKEACIIEHFISDETIRRLGVLIESLIKYRVGKDLIERLMSTNNNGMANGNKDSDGRNNHGSDDIILWKH